VTKLEWIGVIVNAIFVSNIHYSSFLVGLRLKWGD